MAYTLNPEDKFGAKDTLAEGHPEKTILGVELDEEFNKIEGAFAIIDPGGDGSIDIDRVDGLQDALDTEKQERIQGDANLQGQIDSLENYDDAGIKADLATETQARIDGDAALQGQINGLENYDDTQIRADLATETQARIDGDAGLQSQIDGLDLGGAISEAPEDGNQYARQDAAWSIVQATDSANPVVISDDPPASPEEGDLWYCSQADQEGLYCWDGAVWFGTDSPDSAGGAGAGMVISETEPTDKVEGMQWLNPANGLVLFWDDSKWLQMPGGSSGSSDGPSGSSGGLWTDNGDGSISYDGTVTVNGKNGEGLHFDLAGSSDYVIQESTSSDIMSFGGGNALDFTHNISSGNVTVTGDLLAAKAGAGTAAVAIGPQAGRTSQGQYATAVGHGAGMTDQGDYSTALGVNAGETNQGSASVAIGWAAGQTNQAANGIIINSAGTTKTNVNPNHIYLVSADDKFLYYNGTDTWTFAGGTVTGGGLRFDSIVQDGAPVIDAKGLISTLSTLRNATKDETTLEGMRDALADAIGGLIQNLEHEIGTQEIAE
jgi:hypothetical protein